MTTTAHEVRALLSDFAASPWRDLYVRAGGWTVFMAKPDGAANPMRTAAAAGDAVTAPHLGLFTASCLMGDQIETGAELGRLEVLGEFEIIAADRAGTVADVLADDGVLVEYGTPLVRLAA